MASEQRTFARLLASVAALSAMVLALSVVVEALFAGPALSRALDVSQQLALSLLLLSPFARLVGSGVVLALGGEYRYGLYVLSVLLLMGFGLSAGLPG